MAGADPVVSPQWVSSGAGAGAGAGASASAGVGLPPWNKDEPKRLARYVWPQRCGELLRSSPGAGPWPASGGTVHDLRTSDPGRLVALLYERLAGLGLAYEPAQLDFAGHHPGRQLIRPPWELSGSGGNCLELSLLFAGACQYHRLRPLVVLLDGHALVAVWLGGDISPLMSAGRPAPQDYRFLHQGLLRTGAEHEAARRAFLEQVDAGVYLPVECTGFARSAQHGPAGLLSFPDAADTARDRMGAEDMITIVDVALLQHHDNVYQPYPVPVPEPEPAGRPEPAQHLDLDQVRQALRYRDYAGVRHLLRPVVARGGGDVCYYAALGLLAGGRPREFRTEDIRRVEGLLARGADAADDGAAPASALWALVKEDHYLTRGMAGGQPEISTLLPRAAGIGPEYAAEIVTHVRAPECGTWIWLNSIARR